jgi:hypothetical protein
MTTRQETLVAVAVQGDRNFTRITSPAELNDATLDKLAQVVARKAPGRVYQLVRILNRKQWEKGDTLFTWHVGEGFEHSEGWWVRAGEGE